MERERTIGKIETLAYIAGRINTSSTLYELFELYNMSTRVGLDFSQPEDDSPVVKLSDGQILTEILESYIDLLYTDYDAVQHIKTSFVATIVDNLVHRYHIHLDKTIGYSSDSMRKYEFEDYISLLNSQQYGDEFLEYYMHIKAIIHTLSGDYIHSHEKEALTVTHEWVEGNVLAEMVTLWGIMKEDPSKYVYFSYSDINKMLHADNVLLASHCQDLVRRINGVKRTIKNGNYTTKGINILQHALDQLTIAVLSAQLTKQLHLRDTTHTIIGFDDLIKRVEVSLSQ